MGDDYPEWVCFDCGEEHGRRPCGVTTFHAGTCDVCGARAYVTEPRDFGHLHETWKAAKAERGK